MCRNYSWKLFPGIKENWNHHFFTVCVCLLSAPIQNVIHNWRLYVKDGLFHAVWMKPLVESYDQNNTNTHTHNSVTCVSHMPWSTTHNLQNKQHAVLKLINLIGILTSMFYVEACIYTVGGIRVGESLLKGHRNRQLTAPTDDLLWASTRWRWLIYTEDECAPPIRSTGTSWGLCERASRPYFNMFTGKNATVCSW